MLDFLKRYFDPLTNTHEALEWLRNNRNPSALAGNRFESTANAIAFVQSLYDAGAESVAIPKDAILNEQWRIEESGGPYTESLFVKLPKDSTKRRAVWEICDREFTREIEDYKPSPTGSFPNLRVVKLWWD